MEVPAESPLVPESSEPESTEPGSSEPESIYDVVLASTTPDSLRSRFPTMRVWATGAQTALRRRMTDPDELDELLEKLSVLGIPLLDVHRLSGTTAGEYTYEVRVEGEVGESLLCYLDWSHRVVPPQARARILAASCDLHQFLRACTECGASIQRVRRVERTLLLQAAWS